MLVIPPQTPKPPFFNKRREKPWGAGVRRFPRDFLRVRVSLMTTSAGDYLHSYVYVLHAEVMTDCLRSRSAMAVGGKHFSFFRMIPMPSKCSICFFLTIICAGYTRIILLLKPGEKSIV